MPPGYELQRSRSQHVISHVESIEIVLGTDPQKGGYGVTLRSKDRVAFVECIVPGGPADRLVDEYVSYKGSERRMPWPTYVEEEMQYNESFSSLFFFFLFSISDLELFRLVIVFLRSIIKK